MAGVVDRALFWGGRAGAVEEVCMLVCKLENGHNMGKQMTWPGGNQARDLGRASGAVQGATGEGGCNRVPGPVGGSELGCCRPIRRPGGNDRGSRRPGLGKLRKVRGRRRRGGLRQGFCLEVCAWAGLMGMMDSSGVCLGESREGRRKKSSSAPSCGLAAPRPMKAETFSTATCRGVPGSEAAETLS
jgi:hypothetical protein